MGSTAMQPRPCWRRCSRGTALLPWPGYQVTIPTSAGGVPGDYSPAALAGVPGDYTQCRGGEA